MWSSNEFKVNDIKQLKCFKILSMFSEEGPGILQIFCVVFILHELTRSLCLWLVDVLGSWLCQHLWRASSAGPQLHPAHLRSPSDAGTAALSCHFQNPVKGRQQIRWRFYKAMRVIVHKIRGFVLFLPQQAAPQPWGRFSPPSLHLFASGWSARPSRWPVTCSRQQRSEVEQQHTSFQGWYRIGKYTSTPTQKFWIINSLITVKPYGVHFYEHSHYQQRLIYICGQTSHPQVILYIKKICTVRVFLFLFFPFSVFYFAQTAQFPDLLGWSRIFPPFAPHPKRSLNSTHSWTLTVTPSVSVCVDCVAARSKAKQWLRLSKWGGGRHSIERLATPMKVKSLGLETNIVFVLFKRLCIYCLNKSWGRAQLKVKLD